MTSINRVLPFAVEALDIRGKLVVLSSEFDAIAVRHNYPEEVNHALAEATALAVVLGTTLKMEGKFILQAQSDGPISLMVVEFRTPNSIRAHARFDEEAIKEARRQKRTAPHELLGKGALAMTIDQGTHMQRYQGIVALDGSSLEQVAHQYFLQSEQIPTVMRLAVGQLQQEGQTKPSWRIGGLFTQFLPQSEERKRLKDLHGGDGATEDDSDEDDAWLEAKALVETVGDDELLDPNITSERLLYRLFNQHDIKVFDELVVQEACSCNEERISNVLAQLDAQEKQDIAIDGKVEVNCEFCAKTYNIAI